MPVRSILREWNDLGVSARLIFADCFLSERNGLEENVQRHNPLDAHSLGVALADVNESAIDAEMRRLGNERCNFKTIGHATLPIRATERAESLITKVNGFRTALISAADC